MAKRVMAWLDTLPHVQETKFPQRRDDIEGLVTEAAWLTRRAEELRAKAYKEALVLEGDAKARWTQEAVDAAKRSEAQEATAREFAQ